MFLDPIDKDSKAESDDSWVATDLRAFGLHGVTLFSSWDEAICLHNAAPPVHR